MTELLSMDGRYNRSRYILTTAGITLATYALAFAAGLFMGMVGAGEETAAVAGGVVGILANIVAAFVIVKRLHDLNRPGAHFWLLLIPLYNIYLGLVMLFTQGTQGANRYGPSPIGA